eukprot:3938898-Rhodomonas_salina.2
MSSKYQNGTWSRHSQAGHVPDKAVTSQPTSPVAVKLVIATSQPAWSRHSQTGHVTARLVTSQLVCPVCDQLQNRGT